MNDKKVSALEKFLKDMCISKAPFARKLGLSPQRLNSYLSGKTSPPIRIAAVIEKATGGKVKIADWVSSED